MLVLVRVKSKLSYQDLIKKGVPAILIPGIIFGGLYGTGAWEKIKNYYQSELIFPKNGVIKQVEDGDTFELVSGQRVRLIGINAPERGLAGYQEARAEIEKLINQKVWLEYDRYQDDKYGRILAWVWLNCETSSPKFFGANYMHLSGNKSREDIKTKPIGCQQGELLNKVLVDKNLAEIVNYQKRGKLKYSINLPLQ